jgi:hypothetical protein
MSTIPSKPTSSEGTKADWLDIVRDNVANLRFGSVQITVHNGRVTQVESIEKTRFVAPPDGTDAPSK